MPTFHIWTLGCQMNQADSLKLAAGLERAGYAPATDPERADLAVINTCAVRQHAEDRAYGRLHKLHQREGHLEEDLEALAHKHQHRHQEGHDDHPDWMGPTEKRDEHARK